jgi:hypothetical protein
MKLTVGSRVIIKSKYGSIDELKFSVIYKKIKISNQTYAYIIRIDKTLNCYVISEKIDGTAGDYYDENDIELDHKYYRKQKLEKIKNET